MSERVYSVWENDIYREWVDGRLTREFHSRNGPMRNWYGNGQLQSEGNLVNGRVEGVKREWHENGALAREIPYKNGRINGLVRQWNPEGILLGTCQLQNGLGHWREWYDDGRLRGEMEWFDDRNGPRISDRVLS